MKYFCPQYVTTFLPEFGEIFTAKFCNVPSKYLKFSYFAKFQTQIL
jgi:hypothetical protein